MNQTLTSQLEIFVGSIGVILGLFFGTFILINRKKIVTANVFLAIFLMAFSLRIGKSLFHNFFEISPVIRTYFLATLFCVGPSLWLYSKYLFLHTKIIKKIDWLHFLIFLLGLGFAWAIPNNGRSPIFEVFYNLTLIHMTIYILYALMWVLNQRTDISIHSDSMKRWLVSFLAVNLFVITAYILISFMIIPYYLGLSYLFSVSIVFFTIWGLQNPTIYRLPAGKYLNSNLSEYRIEDIHKRLTELMLNEKPFLDSNLSLEKLSNLLGVSAKELSQIINQKEGLNYAQLISKHRIEEVKRLLKSQYYKNYTIASIAYDSGFNSISSFNALFKKFSGFTPKEYRNKNSID